MGIGHSFKCCNCGKSGNIYCDIGMEYPEDCEGVMKKPRMVSLLMHGNPV